MNLVLTETDLVSQPIHEWLGEAAAAETVVLAPQPVQRAPRGVFAGWVTTPDYRDTITELLATEIVLDFPIARLAALGDADLLRAGRLRDIGGLGGQGFAGALRYRDRWTMKDLASDAGVAVPTKMLVEAVGTLPHRLGEIGLPAVVRARWMPTASARVVSDFADVTELMRALTGRVKPYEVMVERHFDAPMLHVDGLMCDSSLHIGVVSEAVVAKTGAETVVALDEDDWRCGTLLAATAKVIAGLGSPDHVQAFHAEFALPPDGEPTLAEIACRHGGDGSVELLLALAGLDLRRESLLGQLGLPPTPIGQRLHGSSGYTIADGQMRVAVGDTPAQVRERLC
ncbi:hypothetical protein [Allorhizocola rhizosphaerae]|uniref:hypothetical protein n=1 Tax=Allorhizocola rhizosphaerae TaxID=1872709 RepID=UPI0013C2D99A|nr:hypothetical protein [Allorhizocola rhizosphaerae]